MRQCVPNSEPPRTELEKVLGEFQTFETAKTLISHPPAAATALLVALGGFKPTVRDTLTVIIGVLIVAKIGEVVRRVRLGGAIAHSG